MVRLPASIIPASIRSAVALAPASARERREKVEAAFPPPDAVASRYGRRRYYAELERGGELFTLPVLAMSLAEAELQARIHCRGRGYRFGRVDPHWDAEEIGGRLQLRADSERGRSAPTQPQGRPPATLLEWRLHLAREAAAALRSARKPPAETESGSGARGGRMSDERDEEDKASGGYSSPACFAHEMDPAYAGYYGDEEFRRLLDRLLEHERAAADLAKLMLEAPPPGTAPMLEALRQESERLATSIHALRRRFDDAPAAMSAAPSETGEASEVGATEEPPR